MQWMVTKSNGRFLCQRQYPKMVLIKPAICGDEIELQAPDMEPIRFPVKAELNDSNIRKVNVHGDIVEAVDLGDDVGNWLSQFLKVEGLRLNFSHPTFEKRDYSNVKKAWNTNARKGDILGFADYSSYMVLSQASMDFLNTKLEKPVPISNFRPNIIVKDCEAFDEDSWNSMRIGDAYFRTLDPCTRCVMPTVDQATGVKDKDGEPLTTLKKIRKIEPYNKPIFGKLFAYDKYGIIRVGDPVYAVQA